MRDRLLAIILALCVMPAAISVATAQDGSHIVVYDSRADHLDENSDGTYDIVRVIASIGTSAGNAMIAVEVIATNEDTSISFWENTTIQSGDTYHVQTTVKAWADGDYTIHLKVWDVESTIIVHDEELGTHELVASLTPPMLSMTLESEPWIFTGDTCLIHRESTDLVGAHYDEMGVVSIQGVPWLVGEYETPLDCSRWPAGDYTVTEHYRNGLGMVATATLSMTIHIHPPPSFFVEVSGRNSETGTPCELVINATQDTLLPEMEIEWEVNDPTQEIQSYTDISLLDCTMWAPGVHKVRATLTSPQGRETMEALNVVRLPPVDDASLEVLNASGDPSRWPETSEGSSYEPQPLFMNQPASIAIVGSGGFVIAVILGIFVGGMIGGESTKEDPWSSVDVAPDSEGLPTFVDESGVHWRQQPDGSVDWWDTTEKQWLRFEQ